jgi:hypothetical protein
MTAATPFLARTPRLEPFVDIAGRAVRRVLVAAALVSLTMLACVPRAHADPVQLALDVSGNISVFTDQATRTYPFDRDALLGLPAKTIKTSTNWTPVSVWRGSTLGAILKQVGAKGKVLHVYALDDYEHDVPISDVDESGVILAYERDGKPLALKDFGPLMLIYPRDAFAQKVHRASLEARFVWQIYKMVVERPCSDVSASSECWLRRLRC